MADFRWNPARGPRPPLAGVQRSGGCAHASGVVGWVAWPLLFPLLGGLRDRGYGLARIAGWLLVGWVHWMAVSLGLWQNRAAR